MFGSADNIRGAISRNGLAIGSRSENHHFLVLQTGSMKPTKNSLSVVILGTQHDSDVKSTSLPGF